MWKSCVKQCAFLQFDLNELIEGLRRRSFGVCFQYIVNEALKNEICIAVLTDLYNLCLKTCLLPRAWLSAIINPIPKSPTSHPRVPSNYRGINLLPNNANLYSALRGNRVHAF